jgi:hypothetical protein
MKILNKAVTTLAGVAAVSAAMITDVQAIPAFARQTGMACVSCHAGNFPALNAFGRAFISSGYTMRGAAPLVEGEDLSIPDDLKLALITKLRYSTNKATDGGRGTVDFPDEAAILAGGRAAENVGFLTEISLFESPNFLSFKTHFNVNPNVALVVYGTDAAGPSYGLEMMNTGAKKSQRPFEQTTSTSAFARIGTTGSAAEGLTLAYHDNDMMVSVGQYMPLFAGVGEDPNVNILGGAATYVRGNYFMNTSGWDLGFGLSVMTGDPKSDDGAGLITTHHVDAKGIDFQALGDIGETPAQFYFSYVVAPKYTGSGTAAYGNSSTDDTVAYTLSGKFNVIPRLHLFAGYGKTDDGSSNDLSELTFGAQYMVAQNIRVELFNTDVSKDAGDGDKTMLMLFSAF